MHDTAEVVVLGMGGLIGSEVGIFEVSRADDARARRCGCAGEVLGCCTEGKHSLKHEHVRQGDYEGRLGDSSWRQDCSHAKSLSRRVGSDNAISGSTLWTCARVSQPQQ
jgi:hypothetical protein